MRPRVSRPVRMAGCPWYNGANSMGKEVARMADKGQKSNKEKKKPKKGTADKAK